MSKYLKVALLIALGVSFLGAEHFQAPSLDELKAKINKDDENYNYVEVNNQSEYDDLVEKQGENLGLSVTNNEHGQVINVVKIRNVSKQYIDDRGKYLHHSSSSSNVNLGLEYTGDISNQEVTNIVEIENSSLETSNTGVSVSTDRTISNSSVHSSTTISNSSIGSD